MSKTPINDGGPAFPMSSSTPDIDFDRGMTLRDYFAAKALAGAMAADPNEDPQSGDLRSWSNAAYASMADHCYMMADAMIYARKRGA